MLISWQAGHHFFGYHVPTVFGSGLVGKPSAAREELPLLYLFLVFHHLMISL